jgi:hypothetical protein
MYTDTTMRTPLQFTTTGNRTYVVSDVNLPSLFNNCENLNINNLADIESCINQVTRLLINSDHKAMPVADFTRLLKFIDEVGFMFKESFIEVQSDCPHNHI